MDKTASTLKEMITISDEAYSILEEELLKLPPKKRKNFKSTLTDKWGVKSKVIYKDGKFYNWSLIWKCWAEIQTHRETIQDINTRREGNTISFISSVTGYTLMKCAELEKQNIQIDTDTIMEHSFSKQLEMNHTGNHYRKHYITAPSSAYGNHSGTH